MDLKYFKSRMGISVMVALAAVVTLMVFTR